MGKESVDFDGHADLVLRVGSGDDSPAIFNASSRALARASPVFDRMLYGDFVESKTKAEDGSWTVDLPNDSPTSMEIFLNITHAHFKLVPKTLSIDELYDLTVLTDFYDATPSLAPWADTWMSSINELPIDASLAPKLLWIAWQLGREEIFENISREILMESEGPLSGDTSPFSEIRMAPDIVGKQRRGGAGASSKARDEKANEIKSALTPFATRQSRRY